MPGGAVQDQKGMRARAAAAVGLRLYVETENQRAQATYTELGMQRCHYWMYESGLDQGEPPTGRLGAD